MTWNKATKTVILCTCGIWIIYDLFAKIVGDHATISEVMMTWAFACPLVPCVWGALAGHFFIPSTRPMTLIKALALAFVTISISVAGYFLIPLGPPFSIIFHPLVVFLIFIGVGAVLFPQKKETT